MDVDMADGPHTRSIASAAQVAGIEYIPPSPGSSEVDDEDVLDDIHKLRYDNDDASVERVINKSGESLRSHLYLISARDRLPPAISLSEETLQPLAKAPRASTAWSVDKWKEHVVNFDVLPELGSSPSKSPPSQSPFPLPTLQSDAAKLPPRPISPERRAYPCDRCDRIFQNRSELRHHARRYEKRPYTCNECDASFLYPKDLRRHKTTHTGSKHYKCPLCHKSFSRKDNLRRHVNNEHGASDVALPDGVPVVARAGSGGGDDSDTEMAPKRDVEVVGNGVNGNEKVHTYIGMDNNRPQNAVLTPHHPNEYQATPQITTYPPADRAPAADASTANGVQPDARSNVLFVRPKPRPRAIPNATPTPPYHPPVRTGITLICPFRRMKPLIHYCYSHPATIKNLVHHMKTTHNTFFHTYCLQIFPSQTALTAHDKQRVCCRSCKKNCGTREIKATHVCKPSELTLDQMWHHLYIIACGDGVWHNPFHGDDYDGAEQEARLRYPPAAGAPSNGTGPPPAPVPGAPAPTAAPAPSPASSSRRRPAPPQHRPMPESSGSMPPDDESSDDGGGSMRPAPRTSPGGSDVSRYAAAGETPREYERSSQRRTGEGVYDARDCADIDDDDDDDEARDEDTEDDDSITSLPTSPAALRERIRDLEQYMKVMSIDSENTKRDLASKTRDYERMRLDNERMMLDRQSIMDDRDRLRTDLNRERTLSRQLTATGEERLAQISRLELDNRSLREAAGAAAAVAAAAALSAQDEEDVDESGFIASDGEADDAEVRSAKRKRTREWQPPAPPLSSVALEPPSLIAASDTVSSSARTRASRRSGVPAVVLEPPSLLAEVGSKASSDTVQVGEDGQLGNSPDWWLSIATVFDQEAGPSGMGYI